MRSATRADRHAPVTEVPEVRELLVLWQHPETREIVPIGRLAHDGETYSFAYTRAAANVQDLRPLPSLPDLRRRYRRSYLPAVFSQRVMDRDRSDYPDYLRSLGLDPAHATPWEQIVSSGGKRAGDTLQFMQVPTVWDGRARSRFLANGVRHIPDEPRVVGGRTITTSVGEQEAALSSLEPGMRVRVAAEEHNPRDLRATLITTGGTPIGYVPRVLSAGVRELMASGPVTPTVARIGVPGTPSHLRLVLDLDVEAPPGFHFDQDGSWEPLATQ